MSRAAIKFKNQIPYGSYWYYEDPFTKQLLQAVTWDNLMARVYEHRRANGNPIGLGLEDEVEDYVCKHQPGECDFIPEGSLRKRSLTLTDIIHGSAVMMALYAAGKPVVDRQEAERRAQICLACPLNVTFAKPCTGICQELKNVVAAIIDHQGTQYDSKLNACSICGCFLQSAIWLRLQEQCHGVTEDMKQQFEYAKEKFNCWKQCQ